jgi:rhodanese-related sulfurtransferase
MTRLSDQPPVAAVLQKFQGAQIVDVRRPAAEDEAPLPEAQRASKGKSLGWLAGLAEGEAHRLRQRQEDLVASGDRAFPDPDAIVRADGFEAISEILKYASGNQTIIAELRKRVTA